VEIETKNNRLAQQIEVAKSVLEAKDKQRLAILALKKGLDDTVKEISERKDALREATAKLGREISTIKHPEIMTPASLSAQFTVEPVRAKLAAESKKAWNIGVSEIVRGMKMQRAFKIFQAACKIAHELAVIKRRH
jgi:seryl-tRNA synthetase